MKGFRFLCGLAAILYFLHGQATEILIVHVWPKIEGESHEIYTIPLLPSTQKIREISFLGPRACHWETANLGHLKNFGIEYNEATNTYLIPDHPDGKEFQLAKAEENHGYAVTAIQANDIDTTELNNLFLGELSAPSSSILKSSGYEYMNRPPDDYLYTHSLNGPICEQVLQLVETAMKTVTRQAYKKRPTRKITSEGGQVSQSILLEGNYPSPNGTPLHIQVFQCGLIYLEVPEDAFLEEPHFSPGTISLDKAPKITRCKCSNFFKCQKAGGHCSRRYHSQRSHCDNISRTEGSPQDFHVVRLPTTLSTILPLNKNAFSHPFSPNTQEHFLILPIKAAKSP